MNPRLRIAVADDEALIRRYYEEVLSDLGHDVVAVAKTGRELVQHCRNSQTPPELVITDIRMPETDGIEAASTIARSALIPIILVSAYHDEDLISRAAESQVMAYLIKPVGRADLETAIRIANSRFHHIRSLEEESERLTRALAERKVIEQAKGLLMKSTGLSEEEAFRRMQKLACDRNEKLVDIARRIQSAGPALELIHRG